jgi:hypothetical protein
MSKKFFVKINKEIIHDFIDKRLKKLQGKIIEVETFCGDRSMYIHDVDIFIRNDWCTIV